MVTWTHIGNAAAFAFLGVVVFLATFRIVDWWTPYDLWKEIVEGRNQALALMVGLVSLGISIIIAAAVHG